MKSAILTLSLLGTAFACRPILRIYESECCGEDYVEIAREALIINTEADLSTKGLENRYIYTCPEGVWLTYHNTNFTGLMYLLYGKGDGLNKCNYENTGRKFGSAKIAGSSADFNARAVLTFPERYLQGEVTTYSNDTSSLNVEFNALLLMGNEDIQLFTGYSFTGLSTCIRANQGYNSTGYGDDDLFTNIGDLERQFGTNDFHSFRFGCDE